jgi:hypothetical protein
MINRQVSKIVLGHASPVKVFTCSTGDVASGAASNGRIIDRLGLGERYGVAAPFALAWGNAGTTVADQKLKIAVSLQHGDSSGGGDMAAFTGPAGSAVVDERTFYTSAQTTPMASWSTGVPSIESNPGAVNLQACKRYIRTVGTLTKPGGTSTSTAAGGADLVNMITGIAFGEPHRSLPSNDSSSTSTSTST